MRGLANTLVSALRELRRYPSAVAGLAIILALVIISIITIFAIPYDEAISMWRGGEGVWQDNPKNARPSWANIFTRADLPATLVLDSQEGEGTKTTSEISEGMTDQTISFTFDFPYDAFPQEMTVFFTSSFNEKKPYVSLTWHTPDGREVRVADFSITHNEAYRFSQDASLQRRLGGALPHEALFADPETLTVLPGQYELRISGLVFEEEAEIDARFVLYGQVHGLAGTDHRRRDLMLALLWGTPIALAFGLLAALGTTITTMVIAAVAVWFGGWVDSGIQRITQVNLILPFLPILIMIGTLYNRSIWLMLGMSILLSIFGGAILTYRAIFLQVKQAPYLEAARAYGASNWRIIFRYLVPRIVPVLIPQLVIIIPTFVFLEASLAVLGLGDPVLPTWGKVIDDARANGALFQGLYYWVLEPAVLLMLTGLAFALVGFALDRIFNPRLREL